MIFQNLEFHNVTELLKIPEVPGYAVRRIPEKIRTQGDFNLPGKTIGKVSVGCEIRFVTNGHKTQVFIGMDHESEFPFLIYRGDYFIRSQQLKAGTIQRIDLNEPERFAWVKPEALTRTRFSPNVWRICFSRYEARYFQIDTFGYQIRPPTAEEKPKLTMLTYGSSITMGSGSSNYYNGYSAHLARFLGVDHLNLGFGGSCHVEESLSDHFAERNDWDFALFELGVNMRPTFTPEEFEKRVTYLFDKVHGKHPNKHLFFVTVFPNHAGYKVKPGTDGERDEKYSEILRQLVKKAASPKVHLLEGKEALPDFSGLTSDLIHPSDEGHLQMALNLSRLMKPFLNS